MTLNKERLVMKREIAAAVILYNPSDVVFDNIASYVNQVNKIYIIDNSTYRKNSKRDKVKAFKNVDYIDNKGNMGIASALNKGSRMAIREGYKYLLTMDQDTYLPADYVLNMIKELRLCTFERIGMISPNYQNKRSNTRWQSVLTTMTTGSILNLEVYSEAGPFLDQLFIDHVDHEYCLRLKALRFQIVRANDVDLFHVPGNLRRISLGVLNFSFTSHSPVRLYYFVRNGLYVTKRYKAMKAFRNMFILLLIKEIAKVPFEQNIKLRLRMIISAVSDFRKNRFGQISM